MTAQNYTAIDHLVEHHKKQKDEVVSFSKEGEPVKLTSESTKNPEIKGNSPEKSIEKEKGVEEYLTPVEEVEIHLDPQLKKAGLQVVDNSKLSPFHKIQLPLSDEKILEGKEKPVTSSWRWFSETLLYILAQSHISLKKIHGKVIRVLKK